MAKHQSENFSYKEAVELRNRLERSDDGKLYEVIPCTVPERYMVKRIRFDEPEITGNFDLSELKG